MDIGKGAMTEKIIFSLYPHAYNERIHYLSIYFLNVYTHLMQDSSPNGQTTILTPAVFNTEQMYLSFTLLPITLQ